MEREESSMEPKEWFNLRNLYKSRMSGKKRQKVDLGCLQERFTMCGDKLGVLGAVGVTLFILGLAQFVIGLYCLLALPNFQLGSNLWTGGLTLLCGCGSAVAGWQRLARSRRGFAVLVALLADLVLNVANLVIVQVGESNSFLTQSDRQLIVTKQLGLTLEIGLWSATILTSLVIIVSFFGAQYIFCLALRSPKLKARMQVTRTISEEDLQQGKESANGLPTIEEVLALPDPAGSSSWVYNNEDNESQVSLYPMGLEFNNDFPDGSRRPPVRHASFATPNKYARVNQRPQRAQSFSTRRDESLARLHHRLSQPIELPELPRIKLNKHYAKPSRAVQRSNSFGAHRTVTSGMTTLSSKFHACSLEDGNTGSVIEVGSLKSSKSDESLNRIGNSNNRSEFAGASKQNLNSFSPSISCFTRIPRPKGPAPLPPTKPKPSLVNADSATQGKTKVTPPKPVRLTQIDKYKKHNTLGHNTTKERPSSTLTNSRHFNQDIQAPECRKSQPHYQGCITAEITPPGDPARETCRPKTRPSTPTTPTQSKPTCTIREEVNHVQEKYGEKNKETSAETQTRTSNPTAKPSAINSANLKKLEKVLSTILDHSSPPMYQLRATKSDESITDSLAYSEHHQLRNTIKRSPHKPSNYEQAQKDAFETSKALLENLSKSDIMKNKIVLRVPSFRTASCQTEVYRPIRRRASCAQTNLSVAPRYRESQSAHVTSTVRWKHQKPQSTEAAPATESSSSSSGYSSPEVSSKEPSPHHSGPPSPASVSDEDERHQSHTNVTIIEINKSEPPQRSQSLSLLKVAPPPPRPPKPIRLRHLSDASSVISTSRHLATTHQRSQMPLPICDELFGLTTLTENVMLLTEAVNPMLVDRRRYQESPQALVPSTSTTTPRVVELIPKTPDKAKLKDDDISRADVFAEEGRTSVLARYKPSTNRSHNLTIPRVNPYMHHKHDSRTRPLPSWRRDISEEEALSDTDDTEASTAAYLASLEILASHYRHQALTNAKQLQLHQKILHQGAPNPPE